MSATVRGEDPGADLPGAGEVPSRDEPAVDRTTGGRPRLRRGPAAGRASAAVLWAMLGWTVGLSRLDDNSFLWHLRTGHWILDHGIPRADPYSYTHPGRPWVAQSWLAEVLYAAIDTVTGPVGIRVLDAAVGGLIALLAFRLTVRLRGDGPTWYLVLPALLASAPLWVERPLLFGVLALTALVWIVEVPDSRAGRNPMLTIPPLLWLWANTHGTFALGFGYLVLHLAGRWLDGARPWDGRERRLLGAAALALVVCVANPYGITLLTFPLELLSRGEVLHDVVEWKSPDFRTPQGFTFAIWIAVLTAVLARAAHRPSRRDLLVVLAFTLLGLWALRNIAVAPLVGLPVAARLLAAAPRAAAPDRTTGPVHKVRRLDVFVVAVTLMVGALWTRTTLTEPAYAVTGYPVRAMQVLDQRGLLGRRLFTSDWWAGYVIHTYWPRQRVFIDDRYDMYPEGFARRYFRARDGAPEWRSLLGHHRVEVVVWGTREPLTQILSREPEWQLIHQDRMATVFVRR